MFNSSIFFQKIWALKEWCITKVAHCMFFVRGKGSWFSPRIIPKKAFHIRQVLIKRNGLKTQKIEKGF